MNRTVNNNGFTLIELLVALTIMAIGILAVVQMQIVAMQSNSIANRLSVATSLAHEVMDDIQSWDVNAPPVSGAFAPPAPDFTVTGNYGRFGTDLTVDTQTVTITNSTYRATYTITLVPPDRTTAFISVTVTGGGRTVTLTSLKRVV